MIAELDEITFKQLIFDYTHGGYWKFKGVKPTIINFYSPWSESCKMMETGLKELSEEYVGFMDFYKVNTSISVELIREFRITSVPALLFIPPNGMPEMSVGALPKSDIEEARQCYTHENNPKTN